MYIPCTLSNPVFWLLTSILSVLQFVFITETEIAQWAKSPKKTVWRSASC